MVDVNHLMIRLLLFLLSILLIYIHSEIEQKQVSEQSLAKLLKKKGLSLLFKAIQDPSNSKQRKLAAKLLCIVAYENEEAQTSICNHSGFCQLSDKICINPIPDTLKAQLKDNPTIIKDIKQIKRKGTLYWCYPAYTKDEEINFPDPLNYLIGFYSYRKGIKRSAPKYNKSVQGKCSSSCLTYTMAQDEKQLIEVQVFSNEMRQSLTQDWRRTTRLSHSALDNPKTDNPKLSSDHLESVIEEMNVGNEISLKTKRELIEELKVGSGQRVAYTQRSALRSNAQKLQTTIFSITQTLPSTKLRTKGATWKKPKAYISTKGSSKPVRFNTKTVLKKK